MALADLKTQVDRTAALSAQAVTKLNELLATADPAQIAALTAQLQASADALDAVLNPTP